MYITFQDKTCMVKIWRGQRLKDDRLKLALHKTLQAASCNYQGHFVYLVVYLVRCWDAGWFWGTLFCKKKIYIRLMGRKIWSMYII